MTDLRNTIALREEMADWQQSFAAATEALRAALDDHPQSALLLRLLDAMEAAHNDLVSLAGTLADAYAESRDESDRLLANVRQQVSDLRDELTTEGRTS